MLIGAYAFSPKTINFVIFAQILGNTKKYIT